MDTMGIEPKTGLITTVSAGRPVNGKPRHPKEKQRRYYEKYDATKHLSLCPTDKGSRPLPCLNGGLLRDAGILQHPMGAGRIELPSLSPEPGVLASYTTPPRRTISAFWLESDGRTAPYPGENPNSVTLIFDRLGFEFILPTREGQDSRAFLLRSIPFRFYNQGFSLVAFYSVWFRARSH